MFLQFVWYVQLHVVRWLKDELSETLVALKQHTAKNKWTGSERKQGEWNM